ncbi:hypothetical protein [Streptomyces sp. NPDC051561]|uniref:hypothetical protein n=1 Tax=Streptomyces sp. NPDC051561 TaxID=3365658 RepID=UPI00378CA8C2
MRLPFVRRTTADALRDRLASAERVAVAQAVSIEAKDSEVQRLIGELAEAHLARKAALAAYENANYRARRDRDQIAELQDRLRTVQEQPDAGETGTDEHGTVERDFAFTILNLAFPQCADVIAQNGGVLPDSYYEALAIYVNGASRYGLTNAEVEELRVRHGLPASIFQRAKDFASRAGAS